jgi:fructose-bisphosphate aldolase class II
MLLSLKEVLPEKGRAVGAFDVVGLEWAEAVLEGAETLGLPVILSVAPHLGGRPSPPWPPASATWRRRPGCPWPSTWTTGKP